MKGIVEKVDDSVCYNYDSLFNEDYMNLLDFFKDFRPISVFVRFYATSLSGRTVSSAALPSADPCN